MEKKLYNHIKNLWFSIPVHSTQTAFLLLIIDWLLFQTPSSLLCFTCLALNSSLTCYFTRRNDCLSCKILQPSTWSTELLSFPLNLTSFPPFSCLLLQDQVLSAPSFCYIISLSLFAGFTSAHKCVNISLINPILTLHYPYSHHPTYPFLQNSVPMEEDILGDSNSLLPIFSIAHYKLVVLALNSENY